MQNALLLAAEHVDLRGRAGVIGGPGVEVAEPIGQARGLAAPKTGADFFSA